MGYPPALRREILAAARALDMLRAEFELTLLCARAVRDLRRDHVLRPGEAR